LAKKSAILGRNNFAVALWRATKPGLPYSRLMKKIFVLGGTGFLGTQVCKKLASLGLQITVPSRQKNAGAAVSALPGVTVVAVDVHDEGALTRAVAGHDAVVNLVAILHGSPSAFERVHVALPRKLLRACLANDAQRLVHVSALGVDGRQPDSAPSEYLRSKGRGEVALLHPDTPHPQLDVRVIRPSVIFGAADKFLNMFAKLQQVFPVMPLAGAQARFQPVWVDDVAEAVVRCLQLPRGAEGDPVIEACGPAVFTLKELVQLSARVRGINGGKGRPVIALPRWMAYVQASLMELAPGEPLMSRDNLESMKTDNVASGTVPGLESLGIHAAALEPIARTYLV
jgi:NADH dehydrogenase